MVALEMNGGYSFFVSPQRKGPACSQNLDLQSPTMYHGFLISKIYDQILLPTQRDVSLDLRTTDHGQQIANLGLNSLVLANHDNLDWSFLCAPDSTLPALVQWYERSMNRLEVNREHVAELQRYPGGYNSVWCPQV